MSLDRYLNPTRRGFLRNALAAVAAPALPKGTWGELEKLSGALPDLSRHALSAIPAGLVKYFGYKVPLTKPTFPRRSIHKDSGGMSTWDIILGSDIEEDDPYALFFLRNLIKFSKIDTKIIPNLPDGSPLLCGHVLNQKNHDLLDDWATEDYHKDGSIEKAWERFQELRFDQEIPADFIDMPLKFLYEQMQKYAEISLDRIVNFGMAIPEGRRIFFEQIREMPEEHLRDLIKRFPEHSDFFKKADEFWERNKNFYEHSNKNRTHPPGHFRMEKSGLGEYKIHAPEIR